MPRLEAVRAALGHALVAAAATVGEVQGDRAGQRTAGLQSHGSEAVGEKRSQGKEDADQEAGQPWGQLQERPNLLSSE